jgi:hypothetical protein
MRQIYKNASQVVVWLGGSSADTELALECASGLARTGNFTANCREHKMSFDQRRRACVRMFDHPWWYRVWVVQEVVMARELIVQCGKQSLGWSSFVELVPKSGEGILEHTRQSVFTFIHDLFPHFLKFQGERNLISSDYSTTMLYLAQQCRYRQSSDPRDKQ